MINKDIIIVYERELDKKGQLFFYMNYRQKRSGRVKFIPKKSIFHHVNMYLNIEYM